MGDAPDEPAPDRLGRYEIRGVVGSGGMGTVFRARDPVLDREVAIKRLRPGTVDLDARRRLVREARALARLSHPNVAAVYDVSTDDGEVTIAMELVDGVTLERWLSVSRRWPEIVDIFLQAARGLDAAHQAGLVHRDFKPGNVLVGDDGRVRVVDFGLARPPSTGSASGMRTAAPSADPDAQTGVAEAGAEDDELTAPGTAIGTPRYMAPEQYYGDADARSDQYCFFVALWAALCGSPPFTGKYLEVAAAKVEGAPPWPAEVDVPRGVAQTIRRGLSPQPSARFASMADAVRALRPARRRSWWIAGALATGAVAAAGLLLGPDEGACPQADALQRTVFDDTHATAVRDALRDTGAPYADKTSERVVAGLEAWTADWAERRVGTCQAHRGGRIDAQDLDRRMGCLDRGRTALGKRIDALLEADRALAENALDLVRSLPAPGACEREPDVTPPPPEDAQAVAEVRDELDRIEVEHSAGRDLDVRDAAEAALERAETLGYGPLVAEANLVAGRVRMSSGEANARSPLERAYFVAQEAGLDRLAFEAAMHRVDAGAEASLESTRPWMGHAKTALDRAGLRGTLDEVRLRLALAAHLETMGEYDEAVQNCGRARELAGAVEAPAELESQILMVLAVALARTGRTDDSTQHAKAAVRLSTEALGPDHPDTAKAHMAVAVGYAHGQRFDDAVPHALEALRIDRAAFGEDSSLVARDHNNAAGILVNAHRLDEGQHHAEKGLAIRTRLFADGHPSIGASHNTLASMFERRGDLARAEEHVAKARASWERVLGPTHAKTLLVRINHASLLIEVDRAEEALQEFRALVEVLEAEPRPGGKLVEAWMGVGRALLAVGRDGESVEVLERALTLARGGEDRPGPRTIVLARFNLAKAQAVRDLPLARATMTAAREEYAATPGASESTLGMLDGWLAEHPSPNGSD